MTKLEVGCSVKPYPKPTWIILASGQTSLSFFLSRILTMLVILCFIWAFVCVSLIPFITCLQLIFIWLQIISHVLSKMGSPPPLLFDFLLFILNVCWDKRVLEINLSNPTRSWPLITTIAQTGLTYVIHGVKYVHNI